jgi:hypothetical protein
MTKRAFALPLFFLTFTVFCSTGGIAQDAFLQRLYDKSHTAQPAPLYFEASCGPYEFNEMLFGLAPGLSKHPPTLHGFGCTGRVEHPITKTFFVGGSFTRAHSSINGTYLTTDAITQAAAGGATLTGVNGYSVFTLRHFTIEARKYFSIPATRFSPFLGFGVGHGTLTDGFKGNANLVIPGYGLMQQPATDHGVYPIWVPTVSLGTLIRIKPNLSAVVSGQWDTGTMLNVGLHYTIPDRVERKMRSVFSKVF